MAQIKWTEPALNDIDEIAGYIALDKPSAARKLVKDIFNSVKRLKKFPESGRNPPELPDTSYRELLVGPCRIFYRCDQKQILVLYVMRSERELREFLLEDRSSYQDS